MSELAMTREQLGAFLADVFPEAAGAFEIIEVAPDRVRLSMAVRPHMLRPGGTVSGPTLFALADYAFYVLVLSRIGPEALTVTTNMSINFMRKPEPTRLWTEARLLKLGRSLAVGDALLFNEGSDAPLAQASGTYAIPPKRSAAG